MVARILRDAKMLGKIWVWFLSLVVLFLQFTVML